MKRLIVLAAAATTLAGCGRQTAPDADATVALRRAGLRQIHITGADPYGCAEGDFSGLRFEAVNLAGRHVSGVVCAGPSQRRMIVERAR